VKRLAAALLLLGGATVAHAHVRPAAFTTVAQRGDGSLVAGATWGLAFRDGGEWSLGCAAAFGVDANVEDAQVAVDGAGTLVLGTFDGLYESTDGCTFSQPAGPLAEGWVVDVAPDGSGGVYAALTRVSGSDQLYHRSAGEAWVPVGEPLDALVGELHGEGPRLWRVLFRPRSAAGPPRVYLERGDGRSFERWELPLEGTEYGATILAARAGEAHLAVRHFDGETVPERLLRFDAMSGLFEEVHRMPQLEAGAWTGDGLWVIGRLGGLELAPDGRAFGAVHEVAGRCLARVDGVLMACTDPARDGVALAEVSVEALIPIVRLEALDSLRSCPAESDAAVVCPSYREPLAEDVKVPVDGVPPPGWPDSGCGCTVPTRERAPRTEGALALAWLALQRRRRKKARAAPIRAKP